MSKKRKADDELEGPVSKKQQCITVNSTEEPSSSSHPPPLLLVARLSTSSSSPPQSPPPAILDAPFVREDTGSSGDTVGLECSSQDTVPLDVDPESNEGGGKEEYTLTLCTSLIATIKVEEAKYFDRIEQVSFLFSIFFLQPLFSLSLDLKATSTAIITTVKATSATIIIELQHH
ncbi:unnamed protein product [Mucor circinelloides]